MTLSSSGDSDTYSEEDCRRSLTEVLIVLGLVVGYGIGSLLKMWLGWMDAPNIGFIVGGALGWVCYMYFCRCRS